MSLTQNEVVNLLQDFAQTHDIPLTLEKSEGSFVSVKRLELYPLDIGNDVIQVIYVEENTAECDCHIRLDDDTNEELMEAICDTLCEKYPYFFTYDNENHVISVHMPEYFSYFEDMPADKAEHLTLHFFRRPVKLIRIFYNTYLEVMGDHPDISNALEKAESEAEENGYYYEYKYNYVKNTAEKKGSRYLLEHRLFRDFFYQQPDIITENFLEDGTEYACYLFNGILGQYDVPSNPAFDLVKVNVVENSAQKRVIRIKLPEAADECACSDIILVYTEDKSYYFTIEIACSENGTIHGYYLCGWDDEDCHSNFGLNIKREQAFKKCLEIIEGY